MKTLIIFILVVVAANSMTVQEQRGMLVVSLFYFIFLNLILMLVNYFIFLLKGIAQDCKATEGNNFK